MNIPELSVESIKLPASILFVGGRRSSKSTTIKYLSIVKGGFVDNHDFIVCFSLSVNVPFYEGFCDQVFIGFDEGKLDEIEETQEEHKERFGKSLRVLLIFDDILTDKRSKSRISRLFQVGRHLNVSLVCLINSKNFAQEIFRNCDMIFVYFHGLVLDSDKRWFKDNLLTNFIKDKEWFSFIFFFLD